MLTNQTAIITGASKGLGASIALKLASKGANVTLAARSDGIFDTAAEIDADEQVLPIETDVTVESDMKAVIEATVSRFGTLDCVVNNAGIPGPFASVEDVDLDDWNYTLAVNLTGMFLLIKHAVPVLRSSDCASVINIGSMQGKQPAVGTLPYAVSKMGVIGLTRTVAVELGPDDITVNAVCPGATEGERIERAIRGRAEKLGISYETAKEQYYLEPTALGRFVEPTDVAELVAFLASERGRHITAQALHVDSGAVWY